MKLVFISYSRQDKEFALELYEFLISIGINAWIDIRKISAGKNWSNEINNALDQAELLILVISPSSMSSKNVEDEWQSYREQGKPILPVLIKPTKIHFQLKMLQYIDFFNQPHITAFRQLRFALREYDFALVGKGETQEIPIDQPPLPIQGTTDDLAIESDQTFQELPQRPEHPKDQRKLEYPTSGLRTRRLEAAMPACTRQGTDTEVRVKLVAPDSEGLRAELPDIIPSGEVIQKSDVRASSFRLGFPLDLQTGRSLSASLCLEVVSKDFKVTAIGEDNSLCSTGQVYLELAPDGDSRTVTFSLAPHSDRTLIGPSRVWIRLYQEGKVIAESALSTQIVENMSDDPICTAWVLTIVSRPGLWGYANKFLSSPKWQGIAGIIAILGLIISIFTLQLPERIAQLFATSTPTATATPTPDYGATIEARLTATAAANSATTTRSSPTSTSTVTPDFLATIRAGLTQTGAAQLTAALPLTFLPNIIPTPDYGATIEASINTPPITEDVSEVAN